MFALYLAKYIYKDKGIAKVERMCVGDNYDSISNTQR